MIIKYLAKKRIISFLILFLFLTGFLSTAYADSVSQYLINDDFSGDALDLSVWNFRTHPVNNAYYEMGDDMISIHSGTTSGSGGSIRSNQQFTPGEDILVFETRARVGYADGGWWGFFGDNHEGTVLIGFNEGILWVEVRPSKDLPAVHVELPSFGIQGTEWHTYRIELSNEYADFYVDDDLVLSQTENIPKYKDLFVWVGRVSWGVDQIAYFDYVTLQSKLKVIDIEIDIKPGSYPNSIYLKSKGNIPVALLRSEVFDVDSVDLASIRFADAAPLRSTYEDIDNDGDVDLLLHFNTQELNLDATSESAIVTGKTLEGTTFAGADSVNVIPK